MLIFNVFAQLEKKAALEKYADSLNKIIHDHVEQNPNTSPRDILLHHASNCELEKYGENEPVKRKRTTDGATTKQTTKRQKATPLLERDQNKGTAAIKSVTQTQKKAVKAREESSVKAMQEMQATMAVSKNFLSSFPSTTRGLAQMQVREMSSEITTPPPLVVTGLQTPTAQPNNIQQGNAIAQRPGQYQARERPDVTTPLIVTGLQTPTARPNSTPQGNADAQGPSQHQSRERSEVRTCLTELQTPTARLSNRQQENAISQCPPQYQARERSPESVQLNVGEREDSSPRSSYEVIKEATFTPESDVVTPPCTEVSRGMLHSSVANVGASYDVWRSSMTALLDMDAEEFEQMSDVTSGEKNVDQDLYEENQALRKENQQLKEQLMNIRQQTDCSHPGKY